MHIDNWATMEACVVENTVVESGCMEAHLAVGFIFYLNYFIQNDLLIIIFIYLLDPDAEAQSYYT